VYPEWTSIMSDMKTNIKRLPFIFINFFLFFGAKAYASTETCTYGEGEAKINVTLHLASKKTDKSTADVTRGSTFSRRSIPLENSPACPSGGTAYAGSNKNADKTILNICFGKNIQGAMNFNDFEGTVFETTELKCNGI
jgi:hypothetical protein